MASGESGLCQNRPRREVISMEDYLIIEDYDSAELEPRADVGNGGGGIGVTP
jgi:hypothetical protein